MSTFVPTSCLSLALFFPLFCGSASAQQSTLLIIIDDVGVDSISTYREGTAPADTPTLDRLASDGVLFRNAWSNPVCSPTRATIQTGRYSMRTGVGTVVSEAGPALSLDEFTLAEALTLADEATSSSLFGKWHLNNRSTGGRQAPNLSGYQDYAGAINNLAPPWNYERWAKTVNGQTVLSLEYATTENVDDARDWILTRDGPFFCTLSFNAAHTPYHTPPEGLYDEELPEGPLASLRAPVPFYRAAIEAVDHEIGRLLDELPEGIVDATNIIFIGDNGTPGQTTLEPFNPFHAKATLYEGGINVPLIISGPSVPAKGAECGALVNASDLFATILELRGVDLVDLPDGAGEDSVSLMPYLSDPRRDSIRDHVYSELFGDNVIRPGQTIRNDRFKLIRYTMTDPAQEEFYDLRVDPFEALDLLTLDELGPIARRNLDELRLALDELTSD